MKRSLLSSASPDALSAADWAREFLRDAKPEDRPEADDFRDFLQRFKIIRTMEFPRARL